MGFDAVIMMSVILLLVWGGFITTLIIATRQERGAEGEESTDGNSDA